jgi:predicted nucleic acid-binding protein
LIYLDTSVALAFLLAEDRRPPAGLWHETIVSSRLLSYELQVRLHARGLAASHGEAAARLIGRVGLLELSPVVLTRALDPFPGEANVRTLDALHLASCSYLLDHGQPVSLASYDRRMNSTAEAMGIPLADLDDS